MEKENLNQFYSYAAKLIANEKKTVKEVAELLKEKGMDAKEAMRLAINVEEDISLLTKKAYNEIYYGLAMVLGGILITYLSYSSAVGRGGGIYIIKFGLVIAGILTMVQGSKKLRLIDSYKESENI